MTTKKKKAPAPKPVRAVIIRVQWTPEDYARLVRIEPRLTDPREHNVEMLVNLLRTAQKQLPSDRQMTTASVRQRVTQNMPKVLASIAAAKASNRPAKATPAPVEPLTPLLDLPSPTQTVAREPAKEVEGPQVAQTSDIAPVGSTKKTFADRILVRWNAREHALIAHEVSALLRKDSQTSAPELVAAVMRAQAKVLPRERWRPRTGLMQGCYKGGRDKLIDRLREGMKTQVGLHVPPVVPSAPEPVAAAVPAPAPIPTSEPPHSAAAPVTGASAIEEAIVALVRKVVREGMPILAQAVAEHAVGLLRGDLGNLLSNIDTTVRKSVTEVVGGPTESMQQQPQSLVQPQPPLSVVPPAARPATPEKQRVDVIGLLNAQANVVRSAMGKQFDLRFIDSNFAEHQRSVAPIVVLCTKFVNHSAQEKAKSHGAHVLFANGAAQSVIEQLQHLQTKKPHDLHASGRA